MSTDVNLVAFLRSATVQTDRHATLVVLLFGTIGNLLNLGILNERSLRQNPCSTYLWWASVSSTAYLWSGLPTRVLGGYSIIWPNQNQPLCKIRLFIVITVWATTLWAMGGASIDRYLCTHTQAAFRRMSTVRTAKQLLAAILAASVVVYVEIFYCYEASVPNVPVACYTQNGPCRGYNDWMNIVYNILIPCLCMAVFSILTVRNIRARAVHPIVNPGSSITRTSNQPRTRQKDRTLTRMLLAQILLVLLSNVLLGIFRMYGSVTANDAKSDFRVALIHSPLVLLSQLACSFSFYLYMLTGSMFRAAFKRVVQRLWCRVPLAEPTLEAK